MKYYILVYGCQMNYSDSERITTVLENLKYTKAKSEQDADLVILVACSVRQSAINRIFGKIRNLKKKQVLVTGCVLKKDLRLLSEKNITFFNIKNLNELPTLVPPLTKGRLGGVLPLLKNYFHIPPTYTDKHTAYIPVMTGCDNYCSYCAVPYTRGREYSRPTSEIIAEIKKAIKNGYKRIFLLGQNVNSYAFKKVKFFDLLEKINDLDGNFWINFTSTHPKDLSDKLIRTMTKCAKVCPQINLPAQSGNNEILRKMNRRYTVEKYLRLIEKLRKHIPNISISTDIIVGFPGETKKQFQDTMKLFGKAKYNMAFINQYSPRPQTAAFNLKDNITKEEKNRRERELTKVLAKTALAHNKKLVGKTIDVLITGKDKDGNLLGITKTMKNVRCHPERLICHPEFISGSHENLSLRGGYSQRGNLEMLNQVQHDIVSTKITHTTPWHLEGKIELPKPFFAKGYERAKLIVILGPTASGKSSLAIKLAKKYNGEIISADSRQIYRKMNIGTGKVKFDCHPEFISGSHEITQKHEMLKQVQHDTTVVQGIPHYMIDIVNPNEDFSLADFQKEALKIIKDIQSRGKIPFLVGGTGLYIQSITDNLQIPKIKPDKKLREKLEKLSLPELQERFFSCHPERIVKAPNVNTEKRRDSSLPQNDTINIDIQNPRRLIRAIEIALSGQSAQPQKSAPLFDTLQIGIDIPREKLYKKINARVDEMIAEGLVEEAKKLAKKYSWDLPAMSGIGYRQMKSYIENKISLQEATELIKRDTRRYAKRQITWFKRDRNIKWISNSKQAEKLVEKKFNSNLNEQTEEEVG